MKLMPSRVMIRHVKLVTCRRIMTWLFNVQLCPERQATATGQRGTTRRTTKDNAKDNAKDNKVNVKDDTEEDAKGDAKGLWTTQAVRAWKARSFSFIHIQTTVVLCYSLTKSVCLTRIT